MNELFHMNVGIAYEKSRSRKLANELWAFKHPDEPVDTENAEYVSWVNSLPKLLGCVHAAQLDDLIAVFEMKTPISNKAIDVLLIGKSPRGENRILLVELKQWASIDTKTKHTNNPDKVFVPEVHAYRRHPVKQLLLYKNNLENHHSGITHARMAGTTLNIGIIAFLHNFLKPDTLYTGTYHKWGKWGPCFFGKHAEQRLIDALGYWFDNSYDANLLDIMKEHTAIMGDVGLEGLRRAYHNETSMTMKIDQQAIVDFVIARLQKQKEHPGKEIIIISGGPGTGKTIVGIRFILEYVKIFNYGKNDNKVMFCLPKSKTVKAVIDAACAVEEDNENEYCSYLQEISANQKLVVVDEAHRITDLTNTLDNVFDKGTKLLILLQDDNQIVRPGEQGTFAAFETYARAKGIAFSPKNATEKDILTLKDEKRCDAALFQGIAKLFYDERLLLEKPIQCVEVVENLEDLEQWKNDNSQTEKTKYIFPFCWRWRSRNGEPVQDIEIGSFRRTWNPEDTDEQVIWLNDSQDDRVACIYTSQGLDMDNVAFIWWDDLVWDEKNNTWASNPVELKDPAFRCRHRDGLWKQTRWDRNSRSEVLVAGGYQLTQADMDILIKNTYYVMLSRPRKKLGIWFKNLATKRHVLQVLGLESQ